MTLNRWHFSYELSWFIKWKRFLIKQQYGKHYYMNQKYALEDARNTSKLILNIENSFKKCSKFCVDSSIDDVTVSITKSVQFSGRNHLACRRRKITNPMCCKTVTWIHTISLGNTYLIALDWCASAHCGKGQS